MLGQRGKTPKHILDIVNSVEEKNLDYFPIVLEKSTIFKGMSFVAVINFCYVYLIYSILTKYILPAKKINFLYMLLLLFGLFYLSRITFKYTFNVIQGIKNYLMFKKNDKNAMLLISENYLIYRFFDIVNYKELYKLDKIKIVEDRLIQIEYKTEEKKDDIFDIYLRDFQKKDELIKKFQELQSKIESPDYKEKKKALVKEENKKRSEEINKNFLKDEFATNSETTEIKENKNVKVKKGNNLYTLRIKNAVKFANAPEIYSVFYSKLFLSGAIYFSIILMDYFYLHKILKLFKMEVTSFKELFPILLFGTIITVVATSIFANLTKYDLSIIIDKKEITFIEAHEQNKKNTTIKHNQIQKFDFFNSLLYITKKDNSIFKIKFRNSDYPVLKNNIDFILSEFYSKS